MTMVNTKLAVGNKRGNITDTTHPSDRHGQTT